MPSGMSASDVCAAIDVLTTKAQSCQGPANQINIVNIALAVTGAGPIPVVIARLSDICSTTLDMIPSITPTTLSVKSDEDAVVKSFTTMVQVYQALLNILIGKAGLVPNLVPFVGPPVAATLRQLEAVTDTLAFELIDAVPDSASDCAKQKDTLDVTIGQAISAWNGGLSI